MNVAPIASSQVERFSQERRRTLERILAAYRLTSIFSLEPNRHAGYRPTAIGGPMRLFWQFCLLAVPLAASAQAPSEPIAGGAVGEVTVQSDDQAKHLDTLWVE